MIESIVASALAIVAAAAPGVLAAATKRETDEEAIAHVLAATRALAEREAKAGDSMQGAWDADLKRRKEGGG